MRFLVFKSLQKTDKEIIDRLTRLATRWKRFGYRRLHVMLQRENIHINHKRTYRLYKEAELALKRRNKKKKYEKRGMPDRASLLANSRWSMDFVSDRTRSGNHIRVLTVIDEATRECLALEVDSSITGKRERLTGVPNQIVRALNADGDADGFRPNSAARCSSSVIQSTIAVWIPYFGSV